MKKKLLTLIIISFTSSVFARSYVTNDKQTVPEIDVVGYSQKECDDKMEDVITKLELKNTVILSKNLCKQNLKRLPAVRFEGRLIFY